MVKLGERLSDAAFRLVSVATLVTSLLGNPFRTTLYFGHMVHKSNGARAGYSVPRGAAVMLIRMTGLVPTVLHWLPLAVVATVIVWSGLGGASLPGGFKGTMCGSAGRVGGVVMLWSGSAYALSAHGVETSLASGWHRHFGPATRRVGCFWWCVISRLRESTRRSLGAD